MFHSIKKDSIFIADSHFNEKNQELLILLEKIANKQLNPSQLFLMGDIIDFISGESKYFIKTNKKVVDLINQISNSIEVFYLEGNHDYNLQSIFPNVKVFKRENQPVNFSFEDKTIAMSHGDIFTPWHYNLYCSIIRNKPLLVFLNLIDFANAISKKIESSLLKKNICGVIDDFDSFAKKRLSNYDTDLVVEGHFHQGKTFKSEKQTYINIPSLCCSKQYVLFDGEFAGVNI
ncbi:UDP-2,3-diacylglucosamine hydrolase [Arcobacter sp. CECT 8989]|uniref:UDP-2,3-diacylglucosamine diphosphatase n=1 Tax=Arcobacter sp. CECT 8989 TaxID=2044509 RepID=UPI00100A7737|nr:UDP-2,3-diacylglucosamine diphosphatase [Arcobacter sp. CECT 8989]RXJ99973.1 UDP-2,3-diacylglucosamine hydrolase [Arcobacter sp. CECT 8989]